MQKDGIAAVCQSPAGALTIVTDETAVTHILFGDRSGEFMGQVRTALHEEAVSQLEEYFTGKRREFTLPLRPQGTPFQLRVWAALRQIPYGETKSYGEIAEMVGNRKACRAVGMANNRNPVCIVIPCHRVIGTDGSLTGYGGGLGIKESLLRLEGFIK